MINRIGSDLTKKQMLFRGHSKRFLSIVLVIAASILFYGFTPSADEDAPLTSAVIVDGETTAVDRYKVFYLETGGNTYEIKTNQETIGAALLADGFLVGEYDEVIPNVDTPVTDGIKVAVTRVYVEFFEVEDTIPFTTKTVENANKIIGYKRVIQAGKDGKIVRTYKKISKEGAGATATLVGETVTEEPVTEMIEIGSKRPEGNGVVLPAEGLSLTPGHTTNGVPYHAIPTMAQKNSVTTIDGNVAVTASGTFVFKERLVCKATAYEGSSASNGAWAGQTATGRAPVYGVVAVDPNVIPLNSKLYIESADGGKSWIYGFAVAGDTGGAIKGNKIDLCYQTLSQCYQFGRRDAIVYVLD